MRLGADVAVLDASDVVDLVTDCESVDPPAAAPGGGGGGGGSTLALTVALSKPRPVGLRALARGKAIVVTATISQPCVATLKLAVRQRRRGGPSSGAGWSRLPRPSRPRRAAHYAQR